MTEYEKMHNGMIYDCLTEELGEVQKHSHRLWSNTICLA